ncbi:hypothetical protein Q4Q34_13510 [Flavivirga abyssicola]|uniref:hypothetical protein n=1 Tax=Flavivirga abyssicola TaxID=3063533 RepID=UPI0026DEC6AB|nr:hypothetical protein [Flavivirga sp. MEBiC07777]WVK12238.1 hypothetical protein Q4Q34_13510 [Flavivirga sp. MEBiC07777]
METLITFIITILTAGISAIITYFVSIKTNLRNKEIEVKKEQEFKYFFPLKHSADELFHRLAHIEKKIFEKESINMQLPQSIENKSFDWYFLDWKDSAKPELGAGGYFLITTIFMHAQLYNRINQLLKEYPFLKLRVKTTLQSKIENNNDQLLRCYEDVINDEHTVGWTKISEVMMLDGLLPIEELIKFIRLSAVMKGGIPYGLQTAFGEFLEKNDGGLNSQINYEEFVRVLMDKEQRAKFSPLINFYTGIVNERFTVDSSKLTKLRALMLSLLMFRDAELV